MVRGGLYNTEVVFVLLIQLPRVWISIVPKKLNLDYLSIVNALKTRTPKRALSLKMAGFVVGYGLMRQVDDTVVEWLFCKYKCCKAFGFDPRNSFQHVPIMPTGLLAILIAERYLNPGSWRRQARVNLWVAKFVEKAKCKFLWSLTFLPIWVCELE